MHTKNGLALLAGLALTTVSAPPVIADSTVQLQGAVVTEDVRVARGGDLVVPVVGVTPDNEILLNRDGISLRQVPTLVFADNSNTRVEGVVDAPISGELVTPRATTRGLVFPGEPNPITLGDWRGARAMGRVKGRHDGTSKVKLVFAGLIPNSLYGVWQFNVGATGTDGPFGGVPNVFVTDAEGSAEMERVLPYNATSVIDHLLVVYHSDQRIYGGVPSLQSGGFVHHAQLSVGVAGSSQ